MPVERLDGTQVDCLIPPVKCVTAPDTPAPFSPTMERFGVPDSKRIAVSAKEKCPF